MSCYFRHMKGVLADAGIEVTSDNKQKIDQFFHQVADVEYKDCPAAWKVLKQDFISDERKRAELVEKLKAAIK